MVVLADCKEDNCKTGDREGKEESTFHGHENCVVQASVLVLLIVEEFLHFETKGRVFSLQYSDHGQCVVLADFC